MSGFLNAFTKAFDVILKPFELLPPVAGLLAISAVTGVVMLLIFGRASDQRRIAQAKDRLKAHIMEMWLFRNEPRAMFQAIGGVARHNLSYLQHSLRPIVFIIVPVVLIMAQCAVRYASDPVPPGRTVRVTAHLRDGLVPTATPVALRGQFGARVMSLPLRNDAERRIDWKVRAEIPGLHRLVFETPGGEVERTMVVGPQVRVGRVAAVAARAGTWDAFLYPSGDLIPQDSVIDRIVIEYPARDLSILGVNAYWLVVFFVVSLVVGYALKGVFGVEV
jgi:uncharacterized membrane protein (DUF106 family)